MTIKALLNMYFETRFFIITDPARRIICGILLLSSRLARVGHGSET